MLGARAAGAQPCNRERSTAGDAALGSEVFAAGRQVRQLLGCLGEISEPRNSGRRRLPVVRTRSDTFAFGSTSRAIRGGGYEPIGRSMSVVERERIEANTLFTDGKCGESAESVRIGESSLDR